MVATLKKTASKPDYYEGRTDDWRPVKIRYNCGIISVWVGMPYVEALPQLRALLYCRSFAWDELSKTIPYDVLRSRISARVTLPPLAA